MTTVRVPDPMLRFTPTPYIFRVQQGGEYAQIESNDLAIALCLRRTCMNEKSEVGIRRLKLIRDHQAPRGKGVRTVLSNGPLHMLLLGTGTMLIFDWKKREVIGFIAPDVNADELAELLFVLLPATRNKPLVVAKTNIADTCESLAFVTLAAFTK